MEVVVLRAAVPAVVEPPVAAVPVLPVVVPVEPERVLKARPVAVVQEVPAQVVPVEPVAVPRVLKAPAVRVREAPVALVERAALEVPVEPARAVAAVAVVLVPHRSWARCRPGRPLRQRPVLRCCWIPGRSAH
ncbi:GHKL domain protein [Mycolicibacterium canariasense]|uniref:GHKL domain protein n=1 Tax=Mycolicibacterium canariasense TaxID=228230 RepID=A0A100WFD8_MYCCR|nr:GHKL domain protein [Mycolicibacterium canariasense]